MTVGEVQESIGSYESRIKELKGKYSGRIFLIGNGPSLNKTPLERMYQQGEYSIAMNNISRLFHRTIWRPTFYFTVSSNLRVKMRQPYFFMPAYLNIPCFIEEAWREVYPDRHNVYWINCPYLDKKEKYGYPALWSNDCSKVVGRHATSMFSVMQIAVYLGFTELYMVGCDMGWKPFEQGEGDPSHFDPNYWEGLHPYNGRQADIETENMTRAHVYAKQALDKLGITVKNATIGGELELYDRVDVYDLLA